MLTIRQCLCKTLSHLKISSKLYRNLRNVQALKSTPPRQKPCGLGSWSSREMQPFHFKWSKESVLICIRHSFLQPQRHIKQIKFPKQTTKTTKDTYQLEKKETDTVWKNKTGSHQCTRAVCSIFCWNSFYTDTPVH